MEREVEEEDEWREPRYGAKEIQREEEGSGGRDGRGGGSRRERAERRKERRGPRRNVVGVGSG